MLYDEVIGAFIKLISIDVVFLISVCSNPLSNIMLNMDNIC